MPQSRFSLVLAAGAAVVAGWLLFPIDSARAFLWTGDVLPAESQRDFRVFNNFADVQANDNQTPVVQFPGNLGAPLAIWKAFVEWGSEAHGDGSGDPTQTVLGSGGANFDFSWQGEATGIGNPNENVVSALTSCGGGTVAFAELPSSDGWRIRFCDDLIWSDGPDVPSGAELDLQAVATHEAGHALGLGHSFPGTVMAAFSPGPTSLRDLSADDQAGVQFIYGIKSAAKPSITGATVDPQTSLVTITGVNFSATGGEVWFTNKDLTSPNLTDPRIRLVGVVSTGGGTQIDVTLPAEAGSGDVLVKQSGVGGATLSNAFPLEIPEQVTIASVSPATVDILIPGTDETVTITGTGFTASSVVELDAVPITTSFTLVDDTTITFDFPLTTTGSHVVGVADPNGADTASIVVQSPALPALQCGSGDPGNPVFTASGIDVLLAGQPGALHDLVASASDLPSVLPGKIDLDLGNGFTQINDLGLFVLDGEGLASFNVPLLPSLGGLTIHLQSVEVVLPLPGGFPWESSNLQEVLVVF